ncbi:MAG: sulfur carrier protein ThiS adenylyltransferase ThiF [Oscillospiraceae bacterium]|nr:sulfur carrier protein ThiS adenylyltransferase ThiF [Oscillospiraceae bacterium]
MLPTKEVFFQALAARHGESLQRRFAESAVAVCGLGGLGSNVAIHLARAGVGRLFLFDFDRVDISNLNRQQYFPEQIGLPKSEALADTIRRIAPYCELTALDVKLCEDNIPSLLRDCEVICECFDRADQKAMLVNCVLETLPDKYLVAASGMAGLGSANAIQSRRVAGKFYLCGDETSEVAEGSGLFSSRVAVCAAHEAHLVLRLLAGETDA